MGKSKYIDDINKLFEKSPVIDFSSIQRIVNDKKNVKQYTRHLIRNLLLKNKINRISRGFYTKYNDPSLLLFCFKNAYLGLQDSLSFHNLWEQETIPVIITSDKVRTGIRKVFESNVLVRRINSKYFFGFKYFKCGRFYFPYSDIEKTFIDMIYFNENVEEDVLKEIKKTIDNKKLKKYLKNYPKIFREKVIRVLE